MKKSTKLSKGLLQSMLLIGISLTPHVSSAQWTKITSGSSNDLFSVDFPSTAVGYAVGMSSTVLKSVDTGKTWTPLSVPCTNCWFWETRFSGKDTGILVGETNPGTNPNGTGVIFKTTNGGATWTDVLTDAATPVRDLYWYNKDTLFAAGGAELASGKIWTSTDGGNSWRATPNTYFDGLLGGLFSFDGKNSFAGLYESVYGDYNPTHTTWLSSNNGFATVGSTVVPASSRYWNFASDKVDSKIAFMSRSTYLSSTDSVYIRKTTDGGLSWREYAIPRFIGALYGMDFVSADTGYMVGEAGTILKSIDAGNTWAKQVSPATEELRSVQFQNPFLGFAVGRGGTILRYKAGDKTDPTAINERLKEATTLSVWPNPSKGLLYIGGLNQHIGQLRILDALGKEVYQTDKPNNEIDLTQLPKGMYLLQGLSNNQQTTTTRFTLE